MNPSIIFPKALRAAFPYVSFSRLWFWVALALLLPRLAGAQNFIPADALVEQQQLNVDPGRAELEGNQLAISGDTITLADLPNYAIQVYTRSGTNWTHQATLTNENFQDAISLTVAIDGDTILASPAPNPREVYVFVRAGTNWTQQATLSSDDEFFGDDVCISGDTAAVGASAAGSVTIFARSGTNWAQQARLVTNVRQNEGGVALDGNTLAIADNSYDHGATFIFTRSGTNWSQKARASAADGANFAVTRRTVSLSGDTLAVGDPDATGTHSDRVYVFTRSGTNWTFQTKLQPPSGQGESDFGRRLSLQDDTLVIGADADSRKGSFAGAVHVYGRSGTNWGELIDITTNLTVAYQQFGYFVGLDGDTVVAWESVAPVHVYVPDYVTAALNDARKLLYSPDAGAAPYDPDQAAFRYKDLLYTRDTNGVSAHFDTISNYYGAAERERAQTAENWVARGLQADLANADLGNLLLDIYYDRTVAQTIFTKNLLAKAESAHFPLAISGLPTPPSGFVIDNEIPRYEQTLATNRSALSGYFSLFTNELGTASSPPLGYQIFAELVPGRGLMPATYMETNGAQMSVVSNNAALFNGYKDLVLLFDQLQTYGTTATTLGKLLLGRDGAGDKMEASNLVSQAQQLLFLDGTMLKNIFASLPGTNDPSGLAQSIQGWSDSLTALTTLQQNLSGGANLLGFSPDFLMYVYSLGGETNVSSYNQLHDYLNYTAPNNHPLYQAWDALQTAEAAYQNYRESQDQYADQITSLDQSYNTRLRDIVGDYPGGPQYSDNPTNNQGSELDQQYQIIQQARLKILKNKADISNLKQSVQIEVNRAGADAKVIIKYGNKNAKLDEEIGSIDAAQSAVNSLADTVANLGQFGETAQIVKEAGSFFGAGWIGGLGLLNAAAQGVGDGIKGGLEAQKERNSAMQQAKITGIDSAATVKTMLLNMNTLLIESQEAALQLQQAVNQLTGLYREKEQLEQKLSQQNASLATRYYADPVHRLQSQADMVEADQRFKVAQMWLFFMERALVYKWNLPFKFTYDGIDWTEKNLFEARNAEELTAMFDAMDMWNVSLSSSSPTQESTDYFSVRDDFFGYAPTNSSGQAQMYADPITGQIVSATQAFRDRLRQLLNTSDPDKSYIDLHFSTVRQVPGKAFFEGPVFASDGTLLSRGLCLDRIRWIKINLPGPHTFGGSYLAGGNLTYGGTSFIRNIKVGTYDTNQPDMLADETTAYSTRHWYFSGNQGVFTSEEAQVASVSMQLGMQAGVEPGPQAPVISVFNERSVATSGWELTIPITIAGTPVLSIDQLDDIEIWFHHVAADRTLN